MPMLLDWRSASQPDELLRTVVEALRQGWFVGLPAEDGYLVLFRADQAAAMEKLPSAGARSLAVLVKGTVDVEAWTGGLSPSVKRLLDRLWPGPLGAIAEAKPDIPNTFGRVVSDDGFVRLRSSRHPLVEAIQYAVDFPLAVRTWGDPEQPIITAADLAEVSGETLAVIVNAGPIEPKPLTWIVLGKEGWRIVETGGLVEKDLLTASARWIAFVCTGNTCRSPMAEALCKAMLAERLKCSVAELPERGFRIFSAGVSAYPGDAPTAEAVEALREWNVDLAEHRSQTLAIEDIARADQIIAMTRGHLLAILSRYPVIGGSMRLLGGIEGDLNDPIGASPDVYTACAKMIRRSLERMIAEIAR